MKRVKVTGGEIREGEGDAVQGFAGHCQNAGFDPEGNEKPLKEFEQRSDMICFIKGPL